MGLWVKAVSRVNRRLIDEDYFWRCGGLAMFVPFSWSKVKARGRGRIGTSAPVEKWDLLVHRDRENAGRILEQVQLD